MTAPIEQRTEEGFTLVELIVYMMLLGLVMTVVGSLIITGIRGQRQIEGTSTASNAGQLIAQSIGTGVRNAAAVKVHAATAAGQLAQAKVGSTNAAGDVTWRCQSWFYSTVDKAVYARSSTSGAVTAPTAGFSGWTLLADRVSLASGVTAPFTAAGAGLAVDFVVGDADSQVLRVASTYKPFAQSAEGTGPASCLS